MIMKTVPVSNARQDIFNIIEQTIVNSEPIQITSKKGDVVMISLEDWSAIQETLYLLQIPGMRESILEGSKESIDECKSLIVLTKQAQKDAQKLEACGLENKAKDLLKIIKETPYQNPPAYEKLKGDLKGFYSRRINIQHRIIYEVYENEKTIKILRMWTHYE
ncbi:MAG: hypothetical protein K0R09_3983 [Clostridiales bacterium]|nr:hypothetical protein [Clostridiales bacterium]